MIFGLETNNLPENWTPLDAVAIVKCLDEDGELGFAIRNTKTLSTWESFGLLEIAAKRQANDILINIDDEDGEEES